MIRNEGIIMEETSTQSLANAVKELAEAINASTANNNRVKLTIFTASTGGEIEMRFNPKQPMEMFMQDLDEVMARREEALKAGQAQNTKYGIGVPKDKKGPAETKGA